MSHRFWSHQGQRENRVVQEHLVRAPRVRARDQASAGDCIPNGSGLQHQHSPSTPHSATDKHLYPELRMIQLGRVVIRRRSLRAD